MPSQVAGLQTRPGCLPRKPQRRVQVADPAMPGPGTRWHRWADGGHGLAVPRVCRGCAQVDPFKEMSAGRPSKAWFVGRQRGAFQAEGTEGAQAAGWRPSPASRIRWRECTQLSKPKQLNT